MPEIVRLKKKKDNRRKRGKHEDIARIYNSSTWQKLRKSKLMECPLCERCLERGITKPAEEVHHVKEISKGEDYYEMCDIAYDYRNLMSLCRDCHHEIHENRRKRRKISTENLK